MAGGITFDRRRWPLSQAWSAAVAVTVTAYAVDREALLAPSRGRGPRPPKALWEARKVAIYLTVLLSDQTHAAIARHIGFHRDTVNSHCADMLEASADDLDLEERLNALRVSAASALAAQISPNPSRMKNGRSSDAASDRAKNNGNVMALAAKAVAA